MTPPWLRCAIALSVLIVCAGCTERRSDAQYQQQLTRSERLVAASIPAIHEHDIADVDWYEQQRTAIRDTQDALTAIAPPRRIEHAHRTYLRGLTGLARVMNALADCAQAERQQQGSGSRCREMITVRELDDVTNDLDEGRAVFADAGFRVKK